MTHVGIDFVALCVIGAAMIFGQIRQVPGNIRYYVMAAAFGIVAVYRLRHGAQGFNLAIVGISIAFGISYAVKGMRYQRPS